MKSCFYCKLTLSNLQLERVWDKELQGYMDHYLCADCRARVWLLRGLRAKNAAQKKS